MGAASCNQGVLRITLKNAKAPLKKTASTGPKPHIFSRLRNAIVELANPPDISVHDFTTIACWWCGYPFDVKPVRSPITFNKCTQEYVTEGNFCCVGCVHAYLNECKRDLRMLKEMYRTLARPSRDNYTKLPLAPHFSTLIRFGGTLTIEEFRELASEDAVQILRRTTYPLRAAYIEHVFTTKSPKAPLIKREITNPVSTSQ